MKITLADIEEAKRVLLKVIDPTPLVPNQWLSNRIGCDVYLKLENMQPIGSFKIRGAVYKLSTLTPAARKRGVIAASAGNHAQGVAWAAAHFKTKATIVMPQSAPLTKIQNTKALGAKVILHGDKYEEAYAQARKLERETGSTFVHPFEDAQVIAGQGTVGLEIAEQLPDAEILIGAVGGGGLMSGIGIVMKALKPKTMLVGAQASGASSMVQSLRKHRVVQTGAAETFADGIRVKNVSPALFRILNHVIDLAADADDEKIAAAVLTLMEKAHTIAEGAGALPLAVLEDLMVQRPKDFRRKKVVLVICGGNIDVNVLGRIIDHGLILNGRRVRLNVSISDRPGSLNLLTRIIAENGANVLQVIHDRDKPAVGFNETGVEMTLETRGPEHGRTLVAAIKKHFPKLEFFH